MEHNRDEIARRAYERYERRGHGDGNDQDDWYVAEEELRNRGSAPPIRDQASGAAAGPQTAEGRRDEASRTDNER